MEDFKKMVGGILAMSFAVSLFIATVAYLANHLGVK